MQDQQVRLSIEITYTDCLLDGGKDLIAPRLSSPSCPSIALLLPGAAWSVANAGTAHSRLEWLPSHWSARDCGTFRAWARQQVPRSLPGAEGVSSLQDDHLPDWTVMGLAQKLRFLLASTYLSLPGLWLTWLALS